MKDEKKIVLVTGANRGLGLEIARQLGTKGFTTLVGARNEAAGKATVEQLMSQGIDAHLVALDITETASIQSAVQTVEKEFGRLDVLVNNAARLPVMSDQDFPSTASHELLTEFIQVNFLAQVQVTQAFLPLIKLSPAGRIVNMSSSIGSVTIASEPLHQNGPKPARLAYASAKAASNMFTVSLAKELADTPIKVNAADPGLTQTDAGGPNAPNTVEAGARPAVWLACLDEDGPTGSFFSHHLTNLIVNPW